MVQAGSFVRVSCTWGGSQDSSAVSVSTDGFLMLEAAEDVMGSTEQNLELVVVNDLAGPLLSAVGSRLAFSFFSASLATLALALERLQTFDQIDVKTKGQKDVRVRAVSHSCNVFSVFLLQVGSSAGQGCGLQGDRQREHPVLEQGDCLCYFFCAEAF